jgi:lipopolysaccharide export system permease protein
LAPTERDIVGATGASVVVYVVAVPIPREPMSILTRYVLRSHIAPALAGLAIFYFVLSMDFIVDYLNLFIAKGVPASVVLEAFVLSLAWMTLLAVPMAVMVAVLTAFGRLSADNEITAAKATGMSVLMMVVPVLIVSGIVSAGLYQFGNHVLPAANHRLKSLLVDIHRIRPLATIEPGVLTELPDGSTIIVDRLNSRTSEIFGVKIHKMEGGQPLQTIVAKRGRIKSSRTENLLTLELEDGEIHEIDQEDPTKYNRLVFDRHTINLDEGSETLIRTEDGERGDRELSAAALLAEISKQDSERAATRKDLAELLSAAFTRTLDRASGAGAPATRAAIEAERASLRRAIEGKQRSIAANLARSRKLLVEYQKKLSIPVSSIVFVLLGAPLGIRARRAGIGIGAGVGIIFFLVYYLFLIGGEQLGDRGIVSPFWAMWAPNVIFGAIGGFLTLSTCLEWRTRKLTSALDFILRAPQAGRGGRDA